MRWAFVTAVLYGCGLPVYSPSDDGFARYELPESPDECSSDGECTLGGCGNHCVSIDAEPFVGTCEYAGHNDYADCACSRNVCRWVFSP